VTSLTLTVAKAIVGLVTMSMAVLASALDSLMDFISMTINFAAVRTAEMPADEKHQFGHGKAESIAGLFQAALIAVSASFLIYQAFGRILRGYALQDEALGIAIIVIAMVASGLLANMMKRAGQRTNSLALTAGALNYGADVWTNAGVLVALGLEKWASVRNADPIISILISLYVVASAVRIGRDSVSELMDRSLPRDMIEVVDSCIRKHGPRIKGYHRLRTRRVGSEKHIEFHVEVDRKLSFEEAHVLTEAVIADIERTIPGSQVTVHTDPA